MVGLILKLILRKWGRGQDWIDLAQERDKWWALVNVVMNLRVPWSAVSFWATWEPVRLSTGTLLYAVRTVAVFLRTLCTQCKRRGPMDWWPKICPTSHTSTKRDLKSRPHSSLPTAESTYYRVCQFQSGVFLISVPFFRYDRLLPLSNLILLNKLNFNTSHVRVWDLGWPPLWHHPRDTTLLDINLLKPTGYVMHQQFNIQQLYVLSTLYLCVLYLSENNQRLVSLTA